MALQILLGVVILATTFIVVVAGIQVFHLLAELRLMVKRVNAVLQNTQTLSDASAKPVAAVNEFFSEVKQLVNNTQNEMITSTPDRVVESSGDLPFRNKTGGRFFRRSGQALRAS